MRTVGLKLWRGGPQRYSKKNASHMRPTFLLDLTNRPISALASSDMPHTMRVGMRVNLSAPFDTGSGTLPAGATGLVTDVDNAEGIVEITMEGEHGALYLWRNKLILVPFETEDLAVLLRCQTVEGVLPSNVVPLVSRRLLFASVVLFAYLLGWAIEPLSVLGTAYASHRPPDHAAFSTHQGNIAL